MGDSIDVSEETLSALLENRDSSAEITSMTNKPSTEAGLITLTRRAWKLYDNIFDEGKRISTLPQSEEKSDALQDIRTTRQLLRDEIIRQTVDESLITALEQRLKTLYNRDITDTPVKFDLSGSAVAAMKSLLQLLEKNYKIHNAVVIEIMRLPNPSAAFTRLLNMVIEANDLSGEPESIIKALTELLHHHNFAVYASDALNANLTIAETLKDKLGPMKKYNTFLQAIDHAQAVKPQQIFNCNYLPLDAAADTEEMFIPEQGNLEPEFKVIRQPAPSKPVTNGWASFKRYMKEHRVMTAVCIGLILVGMAAMAIVGSILGVGLAAVGAGILKKQYDNKVTQWHAEVSSNDTHFEYRDPTPTNTPIYTADHAIRTVVEPVNRKDEDEREGEGEMPVPHR